MRGHTSTDRHGVSHWADPKVAASLTAALALLAIFAVIESRSRHALCGFLAAAGIVLAALIITVITIRIRHEDLAGASPAATARPAKDEPVAGPASAEAR